jgi:hypothetical protein
MQAFSEAAEGIRTLDLLHGKQNVGEGARQHLACKHWLSRRAWDRPVVWDFTPIHGILRTD